MIHRLIIPPHHRGLHDITADVQAVVRASGLREGLCTVFVQHTSASLIVQENADPAVRVDLEAWLSRLVREDDAIYTHREEGPDDMPSHIKGALTAVSIAIPILDGRLALGRWQGLYLWEHRDQPRERTLVVHVAG